MELNNILSDFHPVKTLEEYNHFDEVGLSRIIDWMKKYDTGAITAFRKEFDRKTNLKRNAKLLAQLQSKRYGVTSVKGGYIENYGSEEATPVYENTFFVVNLKETYNLCSDLIVLGEEYNQDSIMFIPKGGQVSQIWGTKNESSVFFPYKRFKEFSNLNIGYKQIMNTNSETGEEVPVLGYNRPNPEFFTLKANKPFFFESIIYEHILPEGWFGRYPCSIMAKATIEEQSDMMLGSLWYPEEYNNITINGDSISLSEATKVNGYWAYGSKIYDVSNSTHIKFIINNPELFNLSLDDIKDIYTKYGERFSMSSPQEGKAREQLIKYVASLGWIRIRHYFQPQDYWSIQCDSIKERKHNIEKFIDWAIQNKLMYYNDPAIILGYDNPEDKETYSYQDGGIKTFLMKEAREKIKESSWSRIVHYIIGGWRFGIVSAYRGSNEYNGWQKDYKDIDTATIEKLDKEAHEKLRMDIKKLEIGYIELKSVYNGQEERSFFLPLVKKDIVMDLGIKYKQQSVIVKSYDPDEFCLYYTYNFTDEDGTHTIGEKGLEFNQYQKINQDGKEVLTFDPEVLKYANSMLLHGSKGQTSKPFAFVSENVKWYEYKKLERWAGLRAYTEGRPTEYWKEIKKY